MKSKKLLIAAFVLLCSAQLYFPAKVVLDNQAVLSQGSNWKFACAPVDPNDPFRGKYITLRFKEGSVTKNDSVIYERDEAVYVTLEEDSLGFARLSSASKTPPSDNSDYIYTTVRYDYSKHDNTIHVNLPFNRFYMEESNAKPAEDAYREARREEDLTVYALVKVQDGNAVLDNVFIDDVSMKEYLEGGK